MTPSIKVFRVQRHRLRHPAAPVATTTDRWEHQMSDNEELGRTVRIVAEHRQATSSSELAAEDNVTKLNPEMDHVEQMIEDFVSRYPAMLDDLRRRWSDTYKQVSKG
jgi:hypothetical protein